MNYYKVEKKRDGQDWKPFNEIYASSFEEAKKQFAKDMTEDNWHKSNNIQWVKDTEGVKKTGWPVEVRVFSTAPFSATES